MRPPPYGIIRRMLREGRVVPFLGAGASMVGRPNGEAQPWTPDAPFLPSGVDLAHHLAVEAEFPSDDPRDRDDLAKVASYYVDIGNRKMLKERLREAFDRHNEIGALHRLLASVDAPLVIVSTNYDTLVERALREAEKPYDLVVYPADQLDLANAVLWWPHGADEPTVEETSTLSIDLECTTVVFKMHGSVAPGENGSERWDSFVITEEDYVEFIFRMTNEAAIPATFFTHFLDRSFLFLGYSLRDWNLRVVLRSLKSVPGRPAEPSGDRPDWAIQKAPSLLEEALWRRRGVHIFDVPLDEFVARLEVPAA